MEIHLPIAPYPIKQITSSILSNPVAHVRRPTKFRHVTIDTAFADAKYDERAQLAYENGKVFLHVTNPDFIIRPDSPLFLTLTYSIAFSSLSRDLIFAGAVQPSDYESFNEQFGTAVPRNSIAKEIVVTSRSNCPYVISYFNPKHPMPFVTPIMADIDLVSKYFHHRWSSAPQPIIQGRASYFAVTAHKLWDIAPVPVEGLAEILG